MTEIIQSILNMQIENPLSLFIQLLSIMILYLIYANFRTLKLVESLNKTWEQDFKISQQMTQLNTNFRILLDQQQNTSQIMYDIKDYLEQIYEKPMMIHKPTTNLKEDI